MTVWNNVARLGTDTTYIALAVQGPNGQRFSQTYGPNKLHKKQTTNWALSSPAINVPADAASKLIISWSAINSGTQNIQKCGKVLSDAATAIGGGGNDPIAIIIGSLGSMYSSICADVSRPEKNDRSELLQAIRSKTQHISFGPKLFPTAE